MCCSVMAKPSGSSPSVPRASSRTADVEQNAAAGDQASDGLDPGDAVALSGDHVTCGAAVPRNAMVEDMA